MASQDDNIDYGYKNRDYVPELGNQSRPPTPEFSASLGYHDENLLRNMLAEIQAMARATIEVAEKQLQDYSLTIEPDSRLEQAQKQEWPSDLGEPRTYVSYTQYKGLESSLSRGAEYIRKSYEDGIRGPFGTNAIDVINSMSAIKNEADNIEEFLDDYMGDVNGTSEFRALELLQDWAENAVERTRDVGTVFTQRTQNPVQIPTSEMDNIRESDARNYQAFFQTKVNAANKEIAQLSDDMKKEYHQMSEVYFKKYLGPALKFQRKVATPLSRNVATETFLGTQAAQADQAMAASYVSLLADQIKRNENFDTRIANFITKVRIRDNYAGFTRQLNTKLDKETVSPFVNTPVSALEAAGLEAYFVEQEALASETNEFSSGHAMLDGTDDDAAHPQYLNRKGGDLHGDVTMQPDVKVDGMRPGLHEHQGIDVDGTPKIKGKNIQDLPTTVIDRTEPICRPESLRHVSSTPHTGTNRVTLVNSQIAWDCDPAMSFEVQKVPVGNTIPTPAPLEWQVTTLAYLPLDVIVAGLGSNFNYVTYASKTALYDFNYVTYTTTPIAGVEGIFGDIVGPSISSARFFDINDLTQDYKNSRVYIADGNKLKMTGRGNSAGHVLPMDIALIYQSMYTIKRVDTQPQNTLNTLYTVEGPSPSGLDRVMKLIDTDGDTSAPGTAVAGDAILKLSDKWTIKDIAVSPSGIVNILTSDNYLRIYDPNRDIVSSHDVSDVVAVPTAITADFTGNVYITYKGQL